MKFKVNRDHFTSGLQQVLNVVGTRATMPILGNVLIEAADGQLAFTTTNLDLGIRCKIKADVQEPGSLTLPVRKLSSIVRELPSLDVEVETYANHQAKIASGSSLFRIMGIGADEFPPLPTFDDQHSYLLRQDDLQRMLKSVSYAQSSDETRYIMNGVFFNFENQQLTLAATDGRRLAVISKQLEVAEENAGQLILPAKTVQEVERLLGKGDNVRIAFNDRQVAFEISAGDDNEESGLVDGIYLVSKVVEGNYPNYRQVIPKSNDRHLKLNRENFANCVRRAALVTSEKNHSVKVTMKENVLEVIGQSPEFGEANVSLNVEYEGPEISVAFNPQFVLDPLRALTRDEIIFEFKDELSPGVIRTQDSFLCVIMPLRLS
ncbi:MAG: DNA polymerase III subunit beta [Verrucomicrobia bacterium]|jgi:DNA polymerase-3 subunit beta|nr:DNA polymerase III subunit beta [Verrucomicrobiota bacterium]